ncbi:MAG TPA: biotin-dependent carboxyltransferase family protein [Thermoanaerobaculia bacterium]|nr:biotin-dependent carboxyltransferase family protein [Thermoanaerobaculia bacterium]
MRGVRVVRPGFFTTVQDAGRRGASRWGVPASGFADPFSAAAANALAGNAADSALLEAALGSVELESVGTVAIGVAGAAAVVAVNGAVADRDRTLVLRSGDRLSIGPATAGLRVYVAVGGGIAVPPVLGSRSALAPSALGGFAGRKLAAGDELPAGDAPAAEVRSVASGALPFDTGVVRALAGPQWDSFPEDARRRFFGAPFRVSPRSDRRGVRLEGDGVAPATGEIDPEGVVVGAVQVPAGGGPIVLMPDGPVTGGYPKIAVAVRADLRVLGQLRPGDMVRFREVSRTEALSADPGGRPREERA